MLVSKQSMLLTQNKVNLLSVCYACFIICTLHICTIEAINLSLGKSSNKRACDAKVMIDSSRYSRLPDLLCNAAVRSQQRTYSQLH